MKDKLLRFFEIKNISITATEMDDLISNLTHDTVKNEFENNPKNINLLEEKVRYTCACGFIHAIPKSTPPHQIDSLTTCICNKKMVADC